MDGFYTTFILELKGMGNGEATAVLDQGRQRPGRSRATATRTGDYVIKSSIWTRFRGYFRRCRIRGILSAKMDGGRWKVDGGGERPTLDHFP